MDGFDRNLTHSLFGLRVDLTDIREAHGSAPGAVVAAGSGDAPSAPETIAVGEDGTNEHGCLACPFCGNTDIQPQRLQITPRCRPDSAVICRHCDAVGPWANTPEIAVKIWNEGFTLRRPASYRAKQKLARSRPPQP